MEEYKSNSDRSRERVEIRDEKARDVKPIIKGPVKVKKKSEIGGFFSNFIQEDMNNIKSYIIIDILIPTIQKALWDTITNVADMMIYPGGSGKNKRQSHGSKISYRNYYEREPERRPTSSYSGASSYDEIVFESRGEAEMVIDAMNDIIAQYGMVSVLDYYDLANYENNNYTMSRYGWTNLSRASTVRVREGYILKLPRAVPLN